MLLDTVVVNPLVAPIAPVNETLHLLDPRSDQPVTLFGSAVNWLAEVPTLEGAQWQTTPAAIFECFRQDLFRSLSYMAPLAREVRIEHSLERLSLGVSRTDVPRGVTIVAPKPEPVIINSLAVYPESSLRLTFKRRILAAFDRTGRGGSNLSSLVADREYWSGVIDERFMEAHQSPIGSALMVDRELIELYPEWVSQRMNKPDVARCILITLQLPLVLEDYRRQISACYEKLALLLVRYKSALTHPGLTFYEHMMPALTKLQQEHRIVGECAELSLMCVGDLERKTVSVPLVALALQDVKTYPLRLLDGTSIELSVPPWKLGQTVSAQESGHEFIFER